MDDPLLFHLHFNTPHVDAAADRLEHLGLPLQRRFGSVRGEGVSLGPGDPTPADFRFKLQVHQAGTVNVTLAPGQRPRFDHLGYVVEGFETALERATDRGWSVRRDDRRTFVMTPWAFRIELHPEAGGVPAELGPRSVAELTAVRLTVDDPGAVQEALESVFGGLGCLHVAGGDGPAVTSFQLRTPAGTRSMAVSTLLAARDDSE